MYKKTGKSLKWNRYEGWNYLSCYPLEKIQGLTWKIKNISYKTTINDYTSICILYFHLIHLQSLTPGAKKITFYCPIRSKVLVVTKKVKTWHFFYLAYVIQLFGWYRIDLFWGIDVWEVKKKKKKIEMKLFLSLGYRK